MVETGRKKGKCNIKCNILKRGPTIIYIKIYIYYIYKITNSSVWMHLYWC